jgi:hypothetical protein
MTGLEWILLPALIVALVVILGVAIVVTYAAIRVTGGVLSAVGWFLRGLWRFVRGTIGDLAAAFGAILTAIVASCMAPFLAFAGVHRAKSAFGAAGRELGVAADAVWNMLARRPLRLLGLGRALGGLEERLPGAIRDGASAAPRGEPAAFPGYEVVATLPSGGSGARLYVAEPDAARRREDPTLPDRVVIKSFALVDGSELPQIVRESRSLEPARALGLVLDHGLDARRFWYAIAFHDGESLAEAAGKLHAARPDGLDADDLRTIVAWMHDLVATLVRYHAAGVWHKDLKPDNVIVAGGRATLVDLGLVTPLRSAMTLTTHGTEYFRDPEMVRQALRGVKVHEVDGARFDVYGAGAVLYLLLEGTFPAHGGLSLFAKPAPESLRWIARRAMADYRQRYASAAELLADLDAVRDAADPAAVRPADLPSVAGSDRESEAPSPPPAGASPPVAAAAAAALAEAVAAPDPRRRPRLKVENWWTGRYGPA